MFSGVSGEGADLGPFSLMLSDLILLYFYSYVSVSSFVQLFICRFKYFFKITPLLYVLSVTPPMI